ncbi:hypothetical protein Ait01nite_019210 [Actinoplanes italicus]|uniref:Uncharacterized protein n=1 Tax=Actinoplanes italicus TaxID=113567 RepID=A0A2T0KPK3_9ACTN|nr:hypothetical protein [Actinoplanes italicus]PRX25673.1 hypothetical protein CLV67_101392 [Actinoplanes italicus]GIE28876.1 hypothetical protein Ait01nite_019210 [Actinoplanes italicus]
MTTPSQPQPAAEKPIGQYLRPLRDLAAYALIAAPAVFLFVAVISLFGEDFTARTRSSFGSFVSTETIFFPLAAVILALGVKPVHPKAKLITMVALGEYAVASFFGVIFGLLFGVSGIAAIDAAAAFNALLVRVAWLAVLGLAAYAVLQVWLGVYPRPAQQPGVYGQPQPQPYQYGPPPGYGQQQPYGAPPPGPVPPGTPMPPPVATQPFSAPPATYGQGSASPYGHYPAVPTPPPPPGWGATPPPPPSSAPPAVPFAEPTQPVPPPPADRTEVLPEDRPGFGPADQDPPRS